MHGNSMLLTFHFETNGLCEGPAGTGLRAREEPVVVVSLCRSKLTSLFRTLKPQLKRSAKSRESKRSIRIVRV